MSYPICTFLCISRGFNIIKNRWDKAIVGYNLLPTTQYLTATKSRILHIDYGETSFFKHCAICEYIAIILAQFWLL